MEAFIKNGLLMINFFLSMVIAVIDGVDTTEPLKRKNNFAFPLAASGLFRSDARSYYDSDDKFLKRYEEFRTALPLSKSEGTDMEKRNDNTRFPFVLKLDESVFLNGHSILLNTYGPGRYSLIDENHGLLFASQQEIKSHIYDKNYGRTQIEETKTYMLSMVASYMIMLPEMKVDPELRDLSMLLKWNDQKVKINALLAPFIESENREMFFAFISDLQTLQSEFQTRYERNDDEEGEQPDNIYSSHQKLQSSLDRKTLLTLQFDMYVTSDDKKSLSEQLQKIDEVIRALAARREILWLEYAPDVMHHNRWARGVADTADYTNVPLDHYNITGRNQVIGIADTGIDMTSCYFNDPNCITPYSVKGNKINTNCRKVIQYVNYTDSFDDYEGHGTHVSATAAGLARQNYGDYKKYNGNAIGAKIAFFDIGNVNSSIPNKGYLTPPQDYYNGLLRVLYRSGARVFSNSWGSSTINYDTHTAQVDLFMWDYPDALVLFSAGNSGCLNQCFSTIGSPAVFKNGLTVGATLNDNQAWLAYYSSSASGGSGGYGDDSWSGAQYSFNSVAGFSSRGPTADKRLKPDVLAVGWWTTSAASSPGATAEHCTVKGLRGTSMATPQTASFAAKIRQYFMDGYYYTTTDTTKGFVPSGALLKAMLVHSSKPMSFIVNSSAYNAKYFKISSSSVGSSGSSSGYPSVVQGYGRIEMKSVLNFGRASSRNPISLFVIGSVNGSQPHYASIKNKTQVDSYSFTTPSGSALTSIRVTLCYTDYPAASGASNVMINILSIILYHPASGVKYAPYLPGGLITSNVQVIDLPASSVRANSLYFVNVSVSSNKLSHGPQPYALVISGQTTYLDSFYEYSYTGSTHSSTYISTGAYPYIAVLSAVAAMVVASVCFFRKLIRHPDEIESASAGNQT